MQLLTFVVPGGPHEQVCIAPLGDFQWSGPNGSTALDPLRRHIAKAVRFDSWYLGMGDVIDFMSPSNRQRLQAAALYDTAETVIEEKAMELVREIKDLVLDPTEGRWIGLVEGHHFTQLADGTTTDSRLAEMLECAFLGTSALVRVEFNAPGPDGAVRRVYSVLYVHHGQGGGLLPSAPLNKLYHVSHGWEQADIYLQGHTTKMPATRLSKPFANWETMDLEHRDILLVNTGGFSKSSIVGHKVGPISRGDYAEQRMLTPSPLSAPILFLWPQNHTDRAQVGVLI